MRGRWASIVAQLRRCHGFPATDTQADPDKNRSIPACAGEPGRPMRGRVAVAGLSPRVRGNPAGERIRRCMTGSIPACAGEPRHPIAELARKQVYPRVCGGTLPLPRKKSMRRGLSPRVRGNLVSGFCSIHVTRSIPACAGEPLRKHRRQFRAEVYPRVCGGTG